MFYLRYLCLFVYGGVQHILYCVCRHLVFCVPNVVSFSELSILDFPFGFLLRLFTHSDNVPTFTSFLLTHDLASLFFREFIINLKIVVTVVTLS